MQKTKEKEKQNDKMFGCVDDEKKRKKEKKEESTIFCRNIVSRLHVRLRKRRATKPITSRSS